MQLILRWGPKPFKNKTDKTVRNHFQTNKKLHLFLNMAESVFRWDQPTKRVEITLNAIVPLTQLVDLQYRTCRMRLEFFQDTAYGFRIYFAGVCIVFYRNLQLRGGKWNAAFWNDDVYQPEISEQKNNNGTWKILACSLDRQLASKMGCFRWEFHLPRSLLFPLRTMAKVYSTKQGKLDRHCLRKSKISYRFNKKVIDNNYSYPPALPVGHSFSEAPDRVPLERILILLDKKKDSTWQGIVW